MVSTQYLTLLKFTLLIVIFLLKELFIWMHLSKYRLCGWKSCLLMQNLSPQDCNFFTPVWLIIMSQLSETDSTGITSSSLTGIPNFMHLLLQAFFSHNSNFFFQRPLSDNYDFSHWQFHSVPIPFLTGRSTQL